MTTVYTNDLQILSGLQRTKDYMCVTYWGF